MSNTTIITQIQDGPTDVVYSYYFEADGASGELNNFVILDPAWLTDGQSTSPYVKPGMAAPYFSLQDCLFNFSGFYGIISFDSAAPLKAWLLAPDTDSRIDWRPLGGLQDRTPFASVPTGKILLSTNGFNSLGSAGSMMLKVRKQK